MQKRVKLSVINGLKIEAVYGLLLEDSKISIQENKISLFNNNSIIIYLESYNNKRNVYLIKVNNINDNIVAFEKKEDISDIFFKSHYLEFSHIFNIAEIDSDNEDKYEKLMEKVNREEFNSTKAKLEEALIRDNIENREIISFLIDINSKIDEILYLLKPKENIEGISEYSSLIISEEGVLFISDRKILKDKIFIYTSIKDKGIFFSFASFCKIEKFMEINGYIIYKGLFIDLNSDIKDKIIKYIFVLEREIIKAGAKK